jgi:hypothetical protein
MSTYNASDNNEIIDKSTGEIIDLAEVKKAKKKKAVEEVEKVNEELKSLGLDSDLFICEYKGETYNCINIKPNYQFDKMFRTSMQDVIRNENLSLVAKALLITIMPFIIFPSNLVAIKNCTSVEEIGELAGLKSSTTYKAFKELIDKEIIKKIKQNGQTLIYVNPYLVSSGLIIERYTAELFKNSKYAPTL